MNKEEKYPMDYSIQGKKILLMSDGILELSEGYYDLSLNNLYEAVKKSMKIRGKK